MTIYKREITRMHQRLNDDHGFTLIELMVAVIVGLVVVAAGFTILTSTNKAVQANEQTADTQQNVRIAMELLARDIKQAGFGMTGPVGNCLFSIMPDDNIKTGPDNGPDSVQLLVPTTRSSGSNRWTLFSNTSIGFSQLTLQAGAVTDMQASGMGVGSLISLNGAATAVVSGLDAGASTITVSPPIPPPVWFRMNTQVYLLQCIRYRVSWNAAECLGSTPCLMRGVAGGVGPAAEAPIVEGIEDLQLSYACDGCVTAINSGIPDRVIDNQGGSLGFDQADFVSNSLWNVPPLTPDKIQLVQIALVSRQRAVDRGFGEGSQGIGGAPAMQVTPDHLLPPAPQYRRRMLVKTVETRNVGL